MDLGIRGKAALVGASTGGLGLGIARALSAEGVRVVVTGRRSEAVETAVSNMRDAVGITCDLTDLDEVSVLLQKAEKAVGAGIDILVLNGSGPPPGPAETLEDAELTKALDQLIRGHRQLVADALPGMRERGWGRILGVGSSGVVEPLPDLAASNIGRAAFAAYIKSLAPRVAGEGVTCNVILPGRIDTDRVRNLDRRRSEQTGRSVDEIAAASHANIPAGRYGSAKEFGQVAAFLCSESSSYITGSQIRVDGGLARSY